MVTIPGSYCLPEEPAVTAPESSISTPRFPSNVQRKILDFLLQSIHGTIGGMFEWKLDLLGNYGRVNKQWHEWTSLEYLHYPSFNLSIMMPFGLPQNSLNWDKIHYNLDRRSRLASEEYLPLGLKLKVDLPRLGVMKPWKKALEKIIKQHNAVTYLELVLDDPQSGVHFELVWRFPRLKRVFLCSFPLGENLQSAIVFPPAPSLSSLPKTLVRLDLAFVVLEQWNLPLPSVKILTLDHVRFGRRTSSFEQMVETCRNVFGSFPNLAALALDGLCRLTSDALSKLGMFKIKQLYLGQCCFKPTLGCDSEFPQGNWKMRDTTFLQCLARHLRTRIKHLYLPSCTQATSVLEHLLSSRIDGQCPFYLAKIESICIAPPPENDGKTVEESAQAKEDEEVIATSFCQTVGLRGVEVKFWDKFEEIPLSEWSPQM